MTVKLENISFDHCIKCTVCTVYCPVSRVTSNYPGPKQSGPDTERLRIKSPELVDSSLKYCNNCKRCEIACPSDVKIADIIQTAKAKYAETDRRPRDFLLSRTDLLGGLSTRFNGPVNLVSGSAPAKFMMQAVFGIPRHRDLPKYQKGTFAGWYKAHAARQFEYSRRAVYFHGCYVNYNDHDLGRDVLTIMNALDIGVVVTREKCCGVPLIANGYLNKARRNARQNTRWLSRAAQEHDAPVVVSSSTCAFALKYEYMNLLGLERSLLTDRVEYITRLLLREFETENRPGLRPLNLIAAYHTPCHLERMGGARDTVALLRLIPGLDLKLLHSECCGLSGTYGFKKEFHQISQDVGSDLFHRIERINPDIVVTDCETCKWQIEMNTRYPVFHPVSLLTRALAEKPHPDMP